MQGAPSALRGYRDQFIYSLNRMLLEQDRTLSFQLETLEDFAVLTEQGQVVELIQVKSYSSPLSPNDISSFLVRSAAALSVNPGLRLTLASFGPVGKDLSEALAGDPIRRGGALPSLLRLGVSQDEAIQVMERVTVETVVRSNLVQEIDDYLGTMETAGAPDVARDLFLDWTWQEAQRQGTVTRAELDLWIRRAAGDIAGRQSFARVWNQSLFPLEQPNLLEAGRQQLTDEYYLGVAARYEHISIGLDVPRPDKAKLISDGLARGNVLIIHGASGQGKSTLGYRFLHNQTNAFRYVVKGVEDRQHGWEIATALLSVARSLGRQLLILVDANPQDNDGWPALIDRLRGDPRVQVLVAVRAEDWRRAKLEPGIPLEELPLDFNEEEARRIYEGLSRRNQALPFIDFTEAWSRFGGQGPLLEFVYLVTQTISLRARLAQQVADLEDRANVDASVATALDVLRIVSVAAAYGARVRTQSLADEVEVASFRRLVDTMESEYLVRRSADGSFLAGLHPIRSEILAELLCNESLRQTRWSTVANRALFHILDQDVETFLLESFTRRYAEREELIGSLASTPRNNWIRDWGVLRALLWLGVKEYCQENSQVIADAKRDAGSGWPVILDTDLVDLMPQSSGSILDVIAEVKPHRRQTIEAIRRRQTPKSNAFARATQWLEGTRASSHPIPMHALEWSAFAEIGYWAATLVASWRWADSVLLEAVELVLPSLELEVLSEVIASLSVRDTNGFNGWIREHESTILARYQRERLVTRIERSSESIKSHYIVDLESIKSILQRLDEDHEVLESASILPSEHSRVGRSWSAELNELAVERVSVLRRLMPIYRVFSGQGYGHRMPGPARLDGSEKNIPIDKLPLPWGPPVNGLFWTLGDQDERPDTWRGFCEDVIAKRESIVLCLSDLGRALSRTREGATGSKQVWRAIQISTWSKRLISIRQPVRLPKGLTKAWAFPRGSSRATDLQGPGAAGSKQPAFITSETRYQPMLKIMEEYQRSAALFFEQSLQYLQTQHPNLGNGQPSLGQEKLRRLSRINLGDLLRESRQLGLLNEVLSHHANSTRLAQLELQEAELLRKVWSLWIATTIEDKKRGSWIEAPVEFSYSSAVDLFKDKIVNAVRGFPAGLPTRVTIEERTLEGDECLCILIRSSSMLESVALVERCTESVATVLRSVSAIEFESVLVSSLWRSIVLIPARDDEVIQPIAWGMNVLVETQSTTPPTLNPTALKPDDMEALGLRQAHGRLAEAALQASRALGGLSDLVGHLSDVSELPEPDAVGQPIWNEYVSKVESEIGGAYSAAVEAVAGLFNGLKEADEAGLETEIANRITLLRDDTIELLGQIVSSFSRDSENGQSVSLSLLECKGWALEVQRAQSLAFGAHIRCVDIDSELPVR